MRVGCDKWGAPTKDLVQKMTKIDAFISFAPLLLWILMIGWSGAWSYRDAKLRGKPPLLVALLVMTLCCPLSALVWVALRPEKIRPPFNLDDYRTQ